MHETSNHDLTRSNCYGSGSNGATSRVPRRAGSVTELQQNLKPGETLLKSQADGKYQACHIVEAKLAAQSAKMTREVTVTPPPATTPVPSVLVDEVGVYFQRGGKWTELSPEVLNWKTGGVIKSVGTLGVVKGDVNGKVRGASSTTHLRQPIELLVYTPEGTAITEYQLIKFRTHSDSREFRTVTGGILHQSGGAERDTLEFASDHPLSEHGQFH